MRKEIRSQFEKLGGTSNDERKDRRARAEEKSDSTYRNGDRSSVGHRVGN